MPLKLANRFVAAVHRHNGETQGAKYAVGVVDDGGLLRGVGIASVPRAQELTSRAKAGEYVIEVARVCTDGAHNACSLLYGACARAGAGMGYTLAVSYTTGDEDGASLKAAGFVRAAETRGQSWARRQETRRRYGHRDDPVSIVPGVRWERRLAPASIGIVLPDFLAAVEEPTLPGLAS